MHEMCDEVSSSSGATSPEDKVASVIDPTAQEFDPVCSYRLNAIESCSQASLPGDTQVSTSFFNSSNFQLDPELSSISFVNTSAEISSTDTIGKSPQSPSGSSTPSEFTTTHFCSEDISDSDVDPFSATVVYSGLSALGDLTNVDTIYNEVTTMCGGNDASIQIHISEFEPCTSTACEVPSPSAQAAAAPDKSESSQTKKSRSSYKHVPHHEKPVQVVERRNARERRRVQSVNSAFVRLRRALPSHAITGRGKRVSKVKTLKAAMNYIWTMQQLLKEELDSSAPSN